MNSCDNCGILLFDESKRISFCNACTQYNEELKKLLNSVRCKCEYCMRSFDWKETGIYSVFNMGQIFTRKENGNTQSVPGPRSELVNDDLRTKWEKEQLQLKKKLVVEDSSIMRRLREKIERDTLKDGEMYIGGVDISFIKGDDVNACSAFVVLSYPDLEIVYEDYQMIKLTAPYIPGFLAFREVEFIIQQYRVLEKTKPEFLPQVIFVDGNGVLHPRGFGLASHLGVLLDVACLGVAKTLIHVDGIENDDSHRDKKAMLKKGGDTFPLQDTSGYVHGMALRSCDNTTNPVFISVGHNISLETAVWLVIKCCKYRIPEPTRKADLNSREYLRVNHPQVMDPGYTTMTLMDSVLSLMDQRPPHAQTKALAGACSDHRCNATQVCQPLDEGGYRCVTEEKMSRRRNKNRAHKH